MGRCKPLLPLGDLPAIVRLIRSLRTGGVAEVAVVVAPPYGDDVAEAVTSLGATVVRNPDPESDMAGSIRAGLPVAGCPGSAVLVCPADHPLVAPGTVAALLAAHEASPGSIVVPVHGGRRGHPTLFPREILDELRALPTLRDVVRRDPARLLLLDVSDPGVLLDLDTPGDYERAVAFLSGNSAE